ncbi:MAG TPA: glutathione S-transferase family protein, partial [Burkholderiales bacterium]|nr:glutathione S-transferase family protein [Burkholderiales bacterium]
SHHVNLRAFEQLEPAFLALNPDAVVPVLVHDGRVIRESLVINEYLEDVFPQPALRPTDAYARARMREWTQYVAAEPTWAVKTPSFNRNIRPEIAGKYSDAELAAIAARMPNQETAARWVKAVKEGFGEAELAASLARLAKTLDRMGAALAASPWLAGDTYTLADLDMAPFVHRIAHIGESAMIEQRPRVADWYQRMRARRAFSLAMNWRP